MLGSAPSHHDAFPCPRSVTQDQRRQQPRVSPTSLRLGLLLYQFLSRVIFITLVYLWAPSSGRYFSGLVNKT